MNKKQKLDIINSVFNENTENQDMAKCPYCTDVIKHILNKENIEVIGQEPKYQESIHKKDCSELDLGDVLDYPDKRDFFFSNAYLTRCHKPECDKQFYIVHKLQDNGTGKSEYSLRKERFEYVKLKFYAPQELVHYLPSDEIIQRYNSLYNAISANDIHLKNMALRSLIDAEVAYSRNEPENKRLSNAIQNAEFLDQDTKDFFEHLILPNSNNSAHSKVHEQAEEKFVEIGISFMDLYFTEKYKHEFEEKEAKRRLKEEKDRIQREKSILINSVKHITEANKARKLENRKKNS